MEIGVIGGVADNGAIALVRRPQGGKLSVRMNELSLGNGPNTVIRSGGSDADRLNRLQLQH